jgi:hypothetical protein
MKKFFKTVSKENIFYICGILLVIITTSSSISPSHFAPSFIDQESYYNILMSSPEFPQDRISANQGHRFTVIYFLGFILQLLNLKNLWKEIFLIFNIVNFVFLLVILNKIIKKLNIRNVNNIKFIIFLSLIFNPYLFRSSIFAPLMINDFLFISGLTLFIYGIQIKNSFYLIAGIIICSVTRQTALIIVVAQILLIFLNFYVKKKNNYFLSFFLIFIIISIFLITLKISKNFSYESQYRSLISGLFISDYLLKDFFTALVRVFFANYLVFIFFLRVLLSKSKLHHFLNDYLFIALIISCGIWTQSILAGPHTAAGNEARWTVLALPTFLIFFLAYSGHYKISFPEKITFFILFFLSSLHHQYSIINKINLSNLWVIFITMPIIIYSFYFFILKNFYFWHRKNKLAPR